MSASMIAAWPGMHSSPPRLNSWCWTVVSSSRIESGTSPASSRPIAELASSMVPYAATRAESLATRLPSPRPVVPSSPVRV
jgi:hypothetical protein